MRWWFSSALLALTLGGCSGDDFAGSSADASAGSGGSAASAGASGASGNGGASGSSGAAGGGGSAGAAAMGGAGGSAGKPSIEIPCGLADAPAPLFYSTLDSLNDVTTPVYGNGSGATTTGTFGPGRCGNALDLTYEGTTLTLPELANVSYPRGTIAFWYRPAYSHTDGLDHAILAVPSGVASTGIRIEKDAANVFVFRIWDTAGAQSRVRINAANYAFTPGEWLHIRIVWDATQDAPIAHVFFNGLEPPVYLAVDKGPINAPATGSGSLKLGCCSGPAAAMFDDLAIWADVVQFP